MAQRIKPTNKKSRTIRSTSHQVSGIDPEQLEDGLGAPKTGPPVSRKGSPYAMTALRQALAGQLCSTGGRPGLAGAVRRQKIPMSDEDWKRLEKLAGLQYNDEIRPTPGQIAGVLLHQALEKYEVENASDDGHLLAEKANIIEE